MKYFNSDYYVEVNDHRYKMNPIEIIILRKRDQPKSLRAHIKYKMKLRYGEISKSSKMITIN